MKIKFYYMRIFDRFDRLCPFASMKVSGSADSGRYMEFINLQTIADDVEQCDRILAIVDDVISGKKSEPYMAYGKNDYVLDVYKDFVNFDLLFSEDLTENPDGDFDIEVFREILTQWRKFLLMPVKMDTFLEFHLEPN